MNIREIRQEQFAQTWIDNGRFGILNLCPRFGKIRTSIILFNKINANKILICYPDTKIKQSWLDDFEKFNYSNPNITFTTHLSLKKWTDKIFDIVIIDEIHTLSENQIQVCKQLFENNKVVLGLTGTLASDTKFNLYKELNLSVLAEYPIEKAVEENVVSNFQINIITVPLDNTIKKNYNGKLKTEKQRFDTFTYLINKKEEEGRDVKFLRLNRMRVIQNSIAKKNKTIEILKEKSDERILVFAGLKRTADELGIPAFHSDTKDKEILRRFAEGEGNQLAVVKMGNTGVTFKPLSQVIINYFSSSSEDLTQKLMRCMSYEYDNPEKIANITIISTNEPVELKWLKKALSKINNQRIVWK